MSIHQHTHKNVYVFAGKDFQKLTCAVSEFENKLFQNDEKHHSVAKTSYFADETMFKAIMTDLYTYPLFSERKVVRVYRAEKIVVSQLHEYLKNPSRATALILISNERLKDWNKKLCELVCSNAVVEEIASMSRHQMVFELKKYFKRRAVFCEHEVVLFLAENIEHSDMSFVQFQGMFDAFWQDRKTLTVDDIVQFFSGGLEYSVFEWIDSLFEKNLVRALSIFRQFVVGGYAQYSSYIHLIYRQLRLMCLYYFAVDASVPANLLSRELNVAPFLLKKIAAHAGSWNLNTLFKQFYKLGQLELQVKSFSHNILAFCFELYIIQFCNSKIH